MAQIRPTQPHGARAGYTLIELMMVVVIIGILAAIAIPSFVSYVQKSKTSEAIAFLGDIKKAQEAYRADWGQYCAVSDDSEDWHPAAIPGEDAVDWNPAPAEWDALGVSPEGFVYFQYQSMAGLPGTTPDIDGDSRGYGDRTFWFISRAQADLDGDGTTVIMESYSAQAGLFINQASGWE